MALLFFFLALALAYFLILQLNFFLFFLSNLFLISLAFVLVLFPQMHLKILFKKMQFSGLFE